MQNGGIPAIPQVVKANTPTWLMKQGSISGMIDPWPGINQLVNFLPGRIQLLGKTFKHVAETLWAVCAGWLEHD